LLQSNTTIGSITIEKLDLFVFDLETGRKISIVTFDTLDYTDKVFDMTLNPFGIILYGQFGSTL